MRLLLCPLSELNSYTLSGVPGIGCGIWMVEKEQVEPEQGELPLFRLTIVDGFISLVLMETGGQVTSKGRFFTFLLFGSCIQLVTPRKPVLLPVGPHPPRLFFSFPHTVG